MSILVCIVLAVCGLMFGALIFVAGLVFLASRLSDEEKERRRELRDWS